MKNLRTILLRAALALFVTSIASVVGAAEPQVGGASRFPNIIFILADDMGYGESDKKQSFFLIT